ncbi:MAG: formate dehydrogenase [Desulfobacteraceae bacterium]|nr:MAG: formate dehydrogenase [Desulfobacteraceae bacterium]
MREVRTVCARDCYDTCSVIAGVDGEGRLNSVQGDPESPVTRGITCPRCAKDAERVYSGRILFPQVRSAQKPGRSFTRIVWDDALDRVAEKLAQTLNTWGPERVLLLKYAGNSGLLSGTFSLRLWNAIGATTTDNGLCSQSGHAGLRLHYGESYGIQPESLHRHRLIVFWGYNPVVSAPHIWNLAAAARRENGAKIAVVDARKSETARKADLWLRPKPGTDAAAAAGIAGYLIEKGLIDDSFIDRWCSGFAEYRKKAAEWTLQSAEAVSGIGIEALEQLAADYGNYRPSATMIGVGLQKSYGGADSVRAASLIPALLGQHRGFFYSNKAGFTIDNAYLNGKRMTRKQGKVVSQVRIAEEIAKGEFKFIFIYGMNPAVTVPNQNLLRRGFCRSDVTTVVHDTHWTETCGFADILLPAQTYLEKEDLVVPWAHGSMRKSNRAIAPVAESRNEPDVMAALAERVGIKEAWVYEDPWEALKKACENAFQDGAFDDLLSGSTLKLRYAAPDAYPTPTGRIELYPETAKEAGADPVPSAFPVDKPEECFVLLASAISNYTHSQFQEIYGPIPALVWLNPEDADRMGICNDQPVLLFNDIGEAAAKAVVTSRVPPGVLWAPHEFFGLDGNFQNSITGSRTQRFGGGSTFNSTIVRIRPAAGLPQEKCSE